MEGQREAKDVVYNWNFMRSPGGTQYFLANNDPNGKPQRPGKESQKALNTLNQEQILLDSCQRTCQQLRWKIFSTWWKYFADPSHQESQTQINERQFEETTKKLVAQIKRAERQIKALKQTIDLKLEDKSAENPLKNVKAGTLPFYYCPRDPTVLIGGIDQGWPSDYLNKVQARLPDQVIAPSTEIPTELFRLVTMIKGRLDSVMTKPMLTAVERLIAEFHALAPQNATIGIAPEGKHYPQFHDALDGFQRDQWGQRQPFRPLYMEWEVEYTHIPFEHWALREQVARLSDNRQVRYGIDIASKKPLWEELKAQETPDTRILSGRMLVLPQPSFSLEAKIKQLFSDTSSSILDKKLPKDRREALLDGVKRLPYLSAPLSGLTDGLLTLAHGTHIKPVSKEVGPNGDTFTAITSACRNEAGFTKQHLEMIGGNSALTPYARLVAFMDPNHCPFKPVAHGQFRFRKLNIIDKFGQTLVGIDPKPRKEGPPPLFPCISDFYQPQTVDGHHNGPANTVIPSQDGMCEFVQMPPQINQNARLNAAFVQRNPPGALSHWRPSTEWENPIWGWVVVNYADSGLQFFLPDGTFYREIRMGGAKGVLEEPQWVPFKPQPEHENASHAPDRMQFDALVTRLRDKPAYCKAFWSMIVTAVNSLPPTPSSYAQYLTAIIGKPLALVNMGLSLELDQPPLQNESTHSQVRQPPISLLRPDDSQSTSLFYQLQVKLGDAEREFDGLVAYFDVANPEKPEQGQELDLKNIYTYFVPENENHSALKQITAEKYPKMTPFWEPPFAMQGGEGEDEPASVSPAVYDDRRNRQLQVYGAMIDPFAAIHAFSSFLPARSLQLASWTWQEAMDRMTAFFHAGPVTLTRDVSDYDPRRQLTTDNARQTPPENVALPALDAGEWNWLQAYVDPSPDATMQQPPVFNAYGIDKMVNWQRPGFEEGPYTAVEGFLQLRRPIMEEKPA